MVISFYLLRGCCTFVGLNTVRISKVKGHADEAMVRASTVRGLDKLGNDGADEAADFGRRRVPWRVTDARRKFFLVFAPGGVLLSLSCIVSLLPFLGLWLIMMMVQVLFLILLSGLLAVLPRGGGLQCGIGLLTWTTESLGWCLDLCCCHPHFLPGY